MKLYLKIIHMNMISVCAEGKCVIDGTLKCSDDGEECICKTNFAGIHCEKCEKGYFGATCQSKYVLAKFKNLDDAEFPL